VAAKKKKSAKKVVKKKSAKKVVKKKEMGLLDKIANWFSGLFK